MFHHQTTQSFATLFTNLSRAWSMQILTWSWSGLYSGSGFLNEIENRKKVHFKTKILFMSPPRRPFIMIYIQDCNEILTRIKTLWISLAIIFKCFARKGSYKLSLRKKCKSITWISQKMTLVQQMAKMNHFSHSLK